MDVTVRRVRAGPVGCAYALSERHVPYSQFPRKDAMVQDRAHQLAARMAKRERERQQRQRDREQERDQRERDGAGARTTTEQNRRTASDPGDGRTS